MLWWQKQRFQHHSSLHVKKSPHASSDARLQGQQSPGTSSMCSLVSREAQCRASLEGHENEGSGALHAKRNVTRDVRTAADPILFQVVRRAVARDMFLTRVFAVTSHRVCSSSRRHHRKPMFHGCSPSHVVDCGLHRNVAGCEKISGGYGRAAKWNSQTRCCGNRKAPRIHHFTSMNSSVFSFVFCDATREKQRPFSDVFFFLARGLLVWTDLVSCLVLSTNTHGRGEDAK